MKATFDDFLQENRNCAKFARDDDAVAIFNLLSKNENITNMIEASEAGKPALLASVSEIENMFVNRDNPTIDLHDHFTRTVVGRMIKSILAPFGYKPSGRKKLPKNVSTYFTSATCYKKTSQASMRIVKTIEEI